MLIHQSKLSCMWKGGPHLYGLWVKCEQVESYQQAKAARPTRTNKVHAVNQQSDESTVEDPECEYLYLTSSLDHSLRKEGVTVPLKIEGVELDFLIDTGANRSIVSKEVLRKAGIKLNTQPCSIRFKGYGGQEILVIGKSKVNVDYNGKNLIQDIIVVDVKEQMPILGRNWLQMIKLDWQNIFALTSKPKEALVSLLREFETSVFKDELGVMTGFQATINMKASAQLKFFRPRHVPFAIEDKAEKELLRLEVQGVINKASPLVVVIDGQKKKVRLCGDYKVTTNPQLNVDQHPLPTQQDLFAHLSGQTCFSKIDPKQAYQQMAVGKNSKKFLTINTHRGLYQMNRLAFGVASAPAIFQSAMDQFLPRNSGYPVLS